MLKMTLEKFLDKLMWEAPAPRGVSAAARALAHEVEARVAARIHG